MLRMGPSGFGFLQLPVLLQPKQQLLLEVARLAYCLPSDSKSFCAQDQLKDFLKWLGALKPEVGLILEGFMQKLLRRERGARRGRPWHLRFQREAHWLPRYFVQLLYGLFKVTGCTRSDNNMYAINSMRSLRFPTVSGTENLPLCQK
jgi:hypothetical protein